MKRNKEVISYPADIAWGAAVAAQRTNGAYLKVAEYLPDTNTVGRRPNKEIMLELLKTPEQIPEADRAQGLEVRKHLTNSVTMQALRRELNDFQRTMADICQLDQVSGAYNLAVLASLPGSFERQQAQEQTQSRLARTDNTTVGAINAKVQLNVEVLESRYSQKWATYYVTAIDVANRALFFAHRSALPAGKHLAIQGTVKRHTDASTQLNRVRVLSERI
jgi:hypothetical protein